MGDDNSKLSYNKFHMSYAKTIIISYDYRTQGGSHCSHWVWSCRCGFINMGVASACKAIASIMYLL